MTAQAATSPGPLLVSRRLVLSCSRSSSAIPQIFGLQIRREKASILSNGGVLRICKTGPLNFCLRFLISQSLKMVLMRNLSKYFRILTPRNLIPLRKQSYR